MVTTKLGHLNDFRCHIAKLKQVYTHGCSIILQMQQDQQNCLFSPLSQAANTYTISLKHAHRKLVKAQIHWSREITTIPDSYNFCPPRQLIP